MGNKPIPSGTVHEMPADLKKALTRDARAVAAWEDITPLARNEWICWTISVKKSETRDEHVGARRKRAQRRHAPTLLLDWLHPSHG